MQQDRIDHTAAFCLFWDGETALCLIYVKPTEAAPTRQPKTVPASGLAWELSPRSADAKHYVDLDQGRRHHALQ
jgi:hypothetical protein